MATSPTPRPPSPSGEAGATGRGDPAGTNPSDQKGPALCAAVGVAETARRSVASGATLVQLRDPWADDDATSRTPTPDPKDPM